MKLWSLIDILKKAQVEYPAFGKKIAEAEALGRWVIAVGPGIANHTRAIHIQNSVLWVEVDHPIWRVELHYRKQQILDILNGKTPSAKNQLSPPGEALTDIQFFSPQQRGLSSAAH